MAGTKRTPIKRPPRARITQRAVDLFRQILDMDDKEVSVSSERYGSVAVDLHRELGLKPWDEFVHWVNVDDLPPPQPNIEPWKRDSFEQAVKLRRQLEELCA
jgi:hypothetical protein